MLTFAEELKARGLVCQYTGDSLEAIVNTPRTLYLGIDPTAKSLHAGNLLPLLVVRRFQEHGCKVVLLVGGGTAQIGDPSGKSEERVLMDENMVRANVAQVRSQVARILGTDSVTFVDNAEWLTSVPVLSFLRDIGKHFSLNEMLRKESVRARIENPDASISFTEFSYMLLQAYDFFTLHEHYGCDLQLGGSDQWGNITAGVELVRKKLGHEVHGVTIPLLVDPKTGKKFGKSESGPIWLEADLLSPFSFYQFWLNTDDALVVQYLKYFTFMPLEEIDTLAAAAAEHPEQREAQLRLAYEVTSIVHGAERAQEAQNVSKAMYGGNFHDLTEAERTLALAAAPSHAYSAHSFEAGIPLVEILTDSAIASSRRDARTLIESGAVSINGDKILDPAHTVTAESLQNGIATLRKGKREMLLLHIG